MARLSLEDRLIRVTNEEELDRAFKHRVAALPKQEAGRLVLVHDHGIQVVDVRKQLAGLAWATGIPVHAGNVRHPGFARVAVTYRTVGGQVRLGTLALLAACWSLWRALPRT